MKILTIILLIFFSSISAQNLKFINKIGEFTSASSFDIDLSENFYVTDVIENNVTKLDKLGKEIYSIGGYGWTESSFDEPVDICATTLSVYIADKNNHRIQRFDKDLNFISIYSNEKSDVDFGYPICINISRMGDLFILDSDNDQILKFSLTGEYLSKIGSNDAGKFSLNNPTSISLDSDNNIYVLDDKLIKVFDQYGNGKISFSHNQSAKKIRIFGNAILYVGENSLNLFDLKERKIISSFTNFDKLSEEIIIDAQINNEMLFVLTPKKIIQYKIVKSD